MDLACCTSLRHLCRTIVTLRTKGLKASLWLTAASTGVTAQDEAGFHTASLVDGTWHSFLSVRKAVRCPIRALIVIRQTSASASATMASSVLCSPLADAALVNAGKAHPWLT